MSGSATSSGADDDLRQRRLSRFGRVLALVALGYVALVTSVSIWLKQLSYNKNSLPMLVGGAAFAALWLLLRGKPRSPRFVRAVELSTLFVGTTAFSSVALVASLTSSPDMIARTMVSTVLLAYAVYVPSSARHTLIVALLMTVPLATSVFLAFSAWDPALHDPPAAEWPKGNIGDMAYPATLVTLVLWGIIVAIAVAFSRALYGLRQAVRDIRRLGQYTLEKKLGEGGMGVVYRASHAMLRRPTAVKLLLPDRAGKGALARFEREVQRTAMLTHPNTVTVFDYGRSTDGVFYYAMELLDGTTLEELVELAGAQPEERVIHLLEQIAASLAEAHDAGLIHRDIKPSNILLVDRGGIADLVKVVDFGLVKDVGGADDATNTNTITGTPLYMAPETMNAPDTVDGRADLYALGAVGYWLLTGSHVFSGKSILEVCAHHLHTAPEPPSARLGSAVSPDLEALLLACLAKHPADRPASARALRESLRRCTAAGRWTSERAAQWWSEHRAALQARHASDSPSSASLGAGAPQLTVTRLAP